VQPVNRTFGVFLAATVVLASLILLTDGCGFLGIDLPLEYHTGPSTTDNSGDANQPDTGAEPNHHAPGNGSDTSGSAGHDTGDGAAGDGAGGDTGSSGGAEPNEPNQPGGEPNEPNEPTFHQIMFERIIHAPYTPGICLRCHKDAVDFLDTAHWKWEGPVYGIAGMEGQIHGKRDLIDNFFIAVPSNEAGCAQCHPGYGWVDNSFDFSNPANIDCLVCHENSGQYHKDQDGGYPTSDTDVERVAWTVGIPTRAGCGNCHFYAGGADNAKHGDLSTALIDPTFDIDVHMSPDGPDLACQNCHYGSQHKMAGVTQLHTNEGEVSCRGCHASVPLHNREILNRHLNRVACQSCHIPRYAKVVPTLVAWYWDEAGQDRTDIPTQEGRPTYQKEKGRLVWATNLRPQLMWYNGTWQRVVVGINDQFTTTPVVLARPLGSLDDPQAKLYPFKKVVGRQPADKINHRLLVPHLFGHAAGDNPFVEKFDWGAALREGAAYAGQEYSGQYEFVDTVMYLSLNHEISPQRQARQCDDCHGVLDFRALGYDGDPMFGN